MMEFVNCQIQYGISEKDICVFPNFYHELHNYEIHVKMQRHVQMQRLHKCSARRRIVLISCCAYTLVKESMPIDVTDMRNGEKKVGNTAKSSQASERFFQITGDEVANWYFAMDCDMSGVASQSTLKLICWFVLRNVLSLHCSCRHVVR